MIEITCKGIGIQHEVLGRYVTLPGINILKYVGYLYYEMGYSFLAVDMIKNKTEKYEI